MRYSNVNRKTMIPLSALVVVVLFLTVPVSSAWTAHGNTWIYSSGNSQLSFIGSKTNIMVENQGFAQNWEVMILNSTTPTTELMGYVGTYTEVIAKQYSVIRTFENNELRLSEVYSFTGNGMEQSVLIQNLQHYNQSFLVLYQLSTGGFSNVYVNGFQSKLINLGSGANGALLGQLSSKDWSLSSWSSLVSWKSSMSAFNSGFLFSMDGLSHMTLAFETTALVYNETYTIDPTITTFPVGNDVSSNSAKIYSYNAFGDVVLAGVISLSVNGPNVAEPTENDWNMQVGTTFESNSGPASGDSFSVNTISQTVSWTGNSAGTTNENVKYYLENDYFQNYQSSQALSMYTVGQFLYQLAKIILSVYGIPSINPFDFLQHSTPNYAYYNSFTKSYSAGLSWIPKLGYTTYYALGTYYPWYFPVFFQPSYMFGMDISNNFESPHFNGNTASNPVVNYFEYKVSIKVTNGLPNNIASGSDYVDFNIGQYA